MLRKHVLFAVVMVWYAFGSITGMAMPRAQLLRDDTANTDRVHYICGYYGRCYWLPRHYVPPYLGPGVYTGYYRNYRGKWW